MAYHRFLLIAITMSVGCLWERDRLYLPPSAVLFYNLSMKAIWEFRNVKLEQDCVYIGQTSMVTLRRQSSLIQYGDSMMFSLDGII